MILLVPESLLRPGVYAINFGESFYDFSVNFDKYDQEDEALDRVTEPGWAGWMKDKYVPYGQYAKYESGEKQLDQTEKVTSPIQIVDVETKWVKRSKHPSLPSPPKVLIVPAIQFRVKNITQEPLENLAFKAVFKFKDTLEKLGDCFYGGIILSPGETSKILLLKSNYGVEGKTKESFIDNPNWKIVEVELFVEYNRFSIPLGKYNIDHKIEGF